MYCAVSDRRDYSHIWLDNKSVLVEQGYQEPHSLSPHYCRLVKRRWVFNALTQDGAIREDLLAG